MPDQQIDYRSFSELQNAARQHLLTIVQGKRTLADIVWSITDIGVRFGIDEAHRDEKQRTAAKVSIPGQIKTFRELVAFNEELALEGLFTPSGNKAPLDRLATELLLASIAYSAEREALKDSQAEKLLNSIVQTAKKNASGKQDGDVEKVEAFCQRLLQIADEKKERANEKVVSYVRRLMNEHDIQFASRLTPSFAAIVQRFKVIFYDV